MTAYGRQMFTQLSGHPLLQLQLVSQTEAAHTCLTARTQLPLVKEHLVATYVYVVTWKHRRHLVNKTEKKRHKAVVASAQDCRRRPIRAGLHREVPVAVACQIGI